MVYMLNSTLAGAVLVGHALLAKVIQTSTIRLFTTMGFIPAAQREKALGSNTLKRVTSAQLNTTEYDAVFIPGLLFLSIKGVAAPMCSTLAVVGQLWYYWLRALVGNSFEGGVDPPPYAPGAAMRYFALGMLAFEIYKLA